ncbi:MAG: hypothetical protein JWQ42_2193 [Edaphobacter sp.]|nr:hypothetical protein [Edaphobacter sp.]
MMNSRNLFFGTLLIALGIVSLRADEILNSLKGTCSITASTEANRFDLRLQHGICSNHRDCNENNIQEPQNAFVGLSLEELRHEGAHIDAVLSAEAGRLTCTGTIHDSKLTGEFTFEPNRAFVEQMKALGITGLNSEKLEAYTLFHIEASWVQSLQRAGVTGIDASNLIAMRIFKVDADYVQRLASLGFPNLPAEKLIAMSIHGVDTADIKQVRAMGYQPNVDELIQMRIFKVTPDFIHRMQAKGLNNLTISKLVQIRIFKLDE